MPLLGFLPVAHVYEATADERVNAMFGFEFRVVDVMRDKASDNRRHPVYHGRGVNTTFNVGRKEGRTLDIEKDSVVLEAWPLKHTFQFRNIFLSVRSHCADPPSAYRDSVHFCPYTYVAYRHQ